MHQRYREMFNARGVHWSYGDIPQASTYAKLLGLPVSIINHQLPPDEVHWAVCHECGHHDLDHTEWPSWWLEIGSNRLWLEGQANRHGLRLAVPPAMLAHYRRELANDPQYAVWEISERTNLPHRIVNQAIFF